jgi:hypothetical protein
MKLSRMADIGGVRAILQDQDSVYRVATRLQRNWTIIRERDYVAQPKDDGYRAVHLISRHRGRLIEIQLRTPKQDNWANLVETLSRTTFPGLKYGDGPLLVREFLFDTAEAYAQEERGLISAVEGLAQFGERVVKTMKALEGNREP